MLNKILPSKISKGLTKIDWDRLYEIRLRAGLPATVNVSGKYYFLGEMGVCFNEDEAVIVSKEELENFIFRASECSIYSVNEQIKEGFITISGGIRIGLAGTLVEEAGNIITLKNFSSVNIRIPHEVKNCALTAIKYLIGEDGFKNTLVISPPGAGKTTFIRDVACQLSNLNIAYNLLVLDERFEIASNVNGENKLNVGKFTDVLSGVTKQFGFECGIRSLRPDIIFTDEIASMEDAKAIEYAVNSGVRVVASVHAQNLTELKRKKAFESIIQNGLFQRYVVLSCVDGPGTYAGIYDEKFSCLYCR